MIIICFQKRKGKTYLKVNYDLLIKIQYWIMNHKNITDSPITNDTLLVKDEYTGKYFYLFIFVIILYY